MVQFILALVFCASLFGSAFAQGGMGPGPGTVHSAGSGPTTLNPSDNAAGIVLSGGNLTMTQATGDGNTRSVASHSSGKFYVEMTVGANTTSYNHAMAVANATASITAGPGSPDTNSAALYNGDPVIYAAGASSGISGGTYTSGDVVGMALDLGNKRIWFRINGGIWNSSGAADPTTNTGGADISAITGPYFVMGTVQAVVSANTFNFGGSAFANTAPSGFGNF